MHPCIQLFITNIQYLNLLLARKEWGWYIYRVCCQSKYSMRELLVFLSWCIYVIWRLIWNGGSIRYPYYSLDVHRFLILVLFSSKTVLVVLRWHSDRWRCSCGPWPNLWFDLFKLVTVMFSTFAPAFHTTNLFFFF